MKIAGENGTLTRTHTEDGVRYELYITDSGGAVRVFDADSGNVVTIKSYPTAAQAAADYARAVGGAK